jgi:hypothetical protein
MGTRRWSALQLTLVVITVAGLAVDAYVHFHLASTFENNKTSTLSEADLFRLEASAAVVAGVAVLLRPRRYTAGLAFLVAAAGTAAVVVYRYVDVGAFGPFPDMYDPFWAPAEKTISLFAEIAATLSALALLFVLHARRHDTGRAVQTQRSGRAAQMSG